MKTYQDLLDVGENEAARMDFVRQVINEFKTTALYRDGVVAYEYARHRNLTINQYQKLLYTITGKAVPDNYSANLEDGKRLLPPLCDTGDAVPAGQRYLVAGG